MLLFYDEDVDNIAGCVIVIGNLKMGHKFQKMLDNMASCVIVIRNLLSVLHVKVKVEHVNHLTN